MDVVRAVIADGEADMKDNDGKTALDFARKNGHDDIVALLKKKGK